MALIRRAGAALLGASLLTLAIPSSLPRAPLVAPRGEPVVVRAIEPERPAPPPSVVPTAPKPQKPPPEPAQAPAPSYCPEEMVLVEGKYCPEVEEECVRWLDDEKLPFARCAVYAAASRCKSERVEKRFCIDRFEHSEDENTRLPLNHQSFSKASKACKAMGKRLCTESEWNFACEGEELLPYPYGRARRPVCNQDRADLFEENPKRRILRDLRWPNAENECKSPFGVYNMVGNLDEPTLLEGRQYGYPFRNALKGGWWMAGRNRCRPATTAHDEHYSDIQIGIRCCRDADPPPG